METEAAGGQRDPKNPGRERGQDFELMPQAVQGLHVSISENKALSRVLSS